MRRLIFVIFRYQVRFPRKYAERSQIRELSNNMRLVVPKKKIDQVQASRCLLQEISMDPM